MISRVQCRVSIVSPVPLTTFPHLSLDGYRLTVRSDITGDIRVSHSAHTWFSSRAGAGGGGCCECARDGSSSIRPVLSPPPATVRFFPKIPCLYLNSGVTWIKCCFGNAGHGPDVPERPEGARAPPESQRVVRKRGEAVKSSGQGGGR